MLTYGLLGAAIGSEVAATLALRVSDGFSRLAPSIVVSIGYPVSFVFLAIVLKRGLGVGVAYALWSAIGVTIVSVVGAAFLGDRLSALQVGGLVLIVAGVVALQLGGKAH